MVKGRPLLASIPGRGISLLSSASPCWDLIPRFLVVSFPVSTPSFFSPHDIVVKKRFIFTICEKKLRVETGNEGWFVENEPTAQQCMPVLMNIVAVLRSCYIIAGFSQIEIVKKAASRASLIIYGTYWEHKYIVCSAFVFLLFFVHLFFSVLIIYIMESFIVLLSCFNLVFTEGSVHVCVDGLLAFLNVATPLDNH